MKNSKLIEILRTFTEEELDGLQKVIDSPFFGIERNVSEFYSYVRKYSPDFTSDDLEEDVAFENLYPGETFKPAKFNNFKHIIIVAAEDFLVFNRLRNDELEYYIILSRAYRDKKLENNALKLIELAEKNLINGFSVRKDYISKFKRISQIKNEHYTQLNDTTNVIRTKANYFKRSSEQFLWDYIDIFGSKVPAESTYGKILDTKFMQAVKDFFDVESFLENVSDEKEENTPYIKISYHLMKILNMPKGTADDHYYKLRDLFFEELEKKEKSLLDTEEKNTLFSYMLNYCAQQFNMKFMEEALKVYKAMLGENAFTESNGFMNQVGYRNIVKTCVSVKESVWLESFIKKYTDELDPENREDMRNLANADLFFVKKEFDKALESVSKVTEKFNLIKFDVRILTLKILYELNDLKNATSLAETFGKFVLNTQIIGEQYRKIYTCFLKYYRKLLTLKKDFLLKKDVSSESGYLFKNIKKEDPFTNQFWLMEKAKEMIKKKN